MTDQEIEFVKDDLRKKGICMPGLAHDLLDHLLCSIEEHLEAGHSFLQAYQLALKELLAEEDMLCIQQEAIQVVSQDRSLLKNLRIYGSFMAALVVAFRFSPAQRNPALILMLLTLGIFFIFHGLFYFRKEKHQPTNVLLFFGITLVPVTGAILFLAKEFPTFHWFGTQAFTILLLLLAIPTYYTTMRKTLVANNTGSYIMVQTLSFLSVASLLWILLLLYVKAFKPATNLAFLFDLSMLSAFSALLCYSIRRKAVLGKRVEKWVENLL